MQSWTLEAFWVLTPLYSASVQFWALGTPPSPGLSHQVLHWLSWRQKREAMRRWKYKEPLLGKNNKLNKGLKQKKGQKGRREIARSKKFSNKILLCSCGRHGEYIKTIHPFNII